MSPGFQMLILWALMQIARSVRMGIQLVRLRALEREIERKLIEHTPEHDPGGATMIQPTLAVQLHLWNNQMVGGGPSVKSLFPGATRKFLGNWPEMSPGFQMLIHWGLMQSARAPKMGIQLVRLRS